MRRLARMVRQLLLIFLFLQMNILLGLAEFYINRDSYFHLVLKARTMEITNQADSIYFFSSAVLDEIFNFVPSFNIYGVTKVVTIVTTPKIGRMYEETAPTS